MPYVIHSFKLTLFFQRRKRSKKYVDHDRIPGDGDENYPAEVEDNWGHGAPPGGRGKKPRGGPGYDSPGRSPPGPYDSPIYPDNSPPGLYDSPSDEDGYPPPPKLSRYVISGKEIASKRSSQ